MCTILISQKYDFTIHIIDIPSKRDDGYSYYMVENGHVYLSQQRAIKKARFILKMRMRNNTQLKNVKRKRTK
jgi:hypothetical protein